MTTGEFTVRLRAHRTAFNADDDLVFAIPRPAGRSTARKVSKRFKAACRAAKVGAVRFHDLRHTFATRLTAAGTPLRTIQGTWGTPTPPRSGASAYRRTWSVRRRRRWSRGARGAPISPRRPIAFRPIGRPLRAGPRRGIRREPVLSVQIIHG
ncbi:MAG: tyrosine-type recombinase/integrase [Solirubrobacterales bacterium]